MLLLEIMDQVVPVLVLVYVVLLAIILTARAVGFDVEGAFSNEKKRRVVYVCHISECDKVMAELRLELRDYPVMGLDCEWEPECGQRNPVDVLSLATENLCAVIQISRFYYIPESLKQVLKDERIRKVGVGILIDVQHLQAHGLSMNNWIDLQHFRYIIDKYPSKVSPQPIRRTLGAMSQIVLGEEIDKGPQLRGNWKSELTPEQIEYAANDAHAGFRICKALLSFYCEESLPRAMAVLQRFSNIQYPPPGYRHL